MIGRSYDNVQLILENNASADEKLRHKFKLFKNIEKHVYDGVTPKEFRKKMNLPILSYEKTREVYDTSDFGDTQSNTVSEKIVVPYWEMHYFKYGFSSIWKDSEKDWMLTDKKDDCHLYFTFRSLLSDDFFKDCEIILGEVYDTINHGSNGIQRIDGDYSKYMPNDFVGIRIVIIEDKNDNIDFLKLLVPNHVFNCFKNPGNFKLSELPQVLFLSENSSFIIKTENIESLVCLDANTMLYSAEGMLILKGNTFLNREAFVSPISAEVKHKEYYLGKNTVFGYQANILSDYIGDNVFVGDDVRSVPDSKINQGCIITDGVVISKFQTV